MLTSSSKTETFKSGKQKDVKAIPIQNIQSGILEVVIDDLFRSGETALACSKDTNISRTPTAHPTRGTNMKGVVQDTW